MTKQQVLERVLAGKALAVVEYRSTVTDAINWRDEQTGRTLVIKKAVHNVEAGPVAMAITERLPENTDLAAYKPPFKKGQLVVWHVETMTRQKGVAKYTGKLEPLE